MDGVLRNDIAFPSTIALEMTLGVRREVYAPDI